MKFNLLQYTVIFFVIGWVIGEACKFDYQYKLFLACLGGFIAAYLNNAHGLLYEKVKLVFKSKKLKYNN